MKYVLSLIFALALQTISLQANMREGFSVKKDTAQYKGSDYAHVVHVERGISLWQAFEIAESTPEIDYFMHIKGYMMVLEIPSEVQYDPSQDPFQLVTNNSYRYDAGHLGSGYCRIFRRGDAVFFKKEGMSLGSAPGLADIYIKDTTR